MFISALFPKSPINKAENTPDPSRQARITHDPRQSPQENGDELDSAVTLIFFLRQLPPLSLRGVPPGTTWNPLGNLESTTPDSRVLKSACILPAHLISNASLQ